MNQVIREEQRNLLSRDVDVALPASPSCSLVRDRDNETESYPCGILARRALALAVPGPLPRSLVRRSMVPLLLALAAAAYLLAACGTAGN